MKKTLAIVAVVALLLVAVAPAAVGVLAERQLRALADPVSVSAATPVRIEAYRRGWFSSTSTAVYALDPGFIDAASVAVIGAPMPAAELVVDSVIRHGPMAVSGIDGHGRLAVASAQSRLTLIVDGTRLRIPGEVLSRIGIDGASTLRYMSGASAIADGDVTLSWSSADILTRYGKDSLTVDGRIDGLSYGSPRSSVAFGQLDLIGAFNRSGTGLWVGLGTADADKMVAARDKVSFSATGLGIISDLRPAGMTSNYRLTVGAAGVSGRDWQGAPATFKFRVDGIDPVQLRNLSSSRLPRDASGAGHSDLLTVLAPGAQVRLEALNLPTKYGQVVANFNLRVPAEVGSPMQAGLGYLLALEGQGRVEMPRPLAFRLSRSYPSVRQVLTRLTRMRLLQSQDNRLSLEAAYGSGLLTINGFPVPLPFVAQ